MENDYRSDEEDLEAITAQAIDAYRRVAANLEKREKAIEQREAHMKKVADLMHANYSKVKERVLLDVGGKRFATSKSSFSRFENSFFWSMLCAGEPCSEDGTYFIDRNPKFFDRILDYLRTGELNAKGLDAYAREKVKRDLQFYLLPLPPGWTDDATSTSAQRRENSRDEEAEEEEEEEEEEYGAENENDEKKERKERRVDRGTVTQTSMDRWDYEEGRRTASKEEDQRNRETDADSAEGEEEPTEIAHRTAGRYGTQKRSNETTEEHHHSNEIAGQRDNKRRKSSGNNNNNNNNNNAQVLPHTYTQKMQGRRRLLTGHYYAGKEQNVLSRLLKGRERSEGQ
ncbi:Potassium channel tetramerization domain-containing protein [Balamuthia mandrillaris]